MGAPLGAVLPPAESLLATGRQAGRCARCGGHPFDGWAAGASLCPGPVATARPALRSGGVGGPWKTGAMTTSPAHDIADHDTALDPAGR